MRIIINSENVDFTLEENLSLSAIIEEVASWAEKQNLYILDYRYSLHKDGNSQNPHRDDLEQIEFLIGNHQELIFSHLEELKHFIHRTGIFLANKVQSAEELTSQEEQQYQEAISFLKESFQTLEKQTGQSNEELQTILSSLEKTSDNFAKLQALALLHNKVNLWLKQLQLASLTPEEKNELIKGFAEQIKTLLSQLEKIAISFTAGKEATALSELEQVAERLTDNLSLLLTQAKPPIAAMKLITVLSNLTAALDASDMVTVADLIDFDLRECLSELESQISL